MKQKELTVNALLVAAKNAGMESSSDHPEDIAAAMSSAVEHAWPVVEYFSDKNLT